MSKAVTTLLKTSSNQPTTTSSTPSSEQKESEDDDSDYNVFSSMEGYAENVLKSATRKHSQK